MVRRSLAAALSLGALAACSPDSPVPSSPAVSASLSSAASLDAAERRHLVVFSGHAIPSSFEASVAALGGSVALRMDQIGVASVAGLSDDAAAALATSEGVQQIGVEDEVTLAEPTEVSAAEATEGASADEQSPSNPAGAVQYARQWNMRQIGANKAWAAGKLGSAATRVFILDTGIDYTHPDLAGRVDLSLSKSFVPGDDAFLEQLGTQNPYFANRHPVADMHFHGTHVGATVSSNADLAAGVTSKVTLVGVKVLGRNGRSVAGSVIGGMLYAADNDADVINMSLGGGFTRAGGRGPTVAAINRAVNYVRQQGTLVVVAAGNDNKDLQHMVAQTGTSDSASYYASYCDAPNVICVSATGPTAGGTFGPWANIDNRAGYSNYGNSIFVAAPGGTGAGFVWAACSRFVPTGQLAVCRTGTARFVVGSTGTSMATPHVAGLAALLVEKVGKNNPAQLRAAVKAATDDLGAVDRDPIYGFGRINVAKAFGL